MQKEIKEERKKEIKEEKRNKERQERYVVAMKEVKIF